MAQSANYYVYEHWRPDKDVCFYVGKGKGGRAKMSEAAKLRWKRQKMEPQI